MRTGFKRHLDQAKCNTSLATLREQFPDNKKGRYKLKDGGGLFLEISPADRRGWRFSYQRPDTKKPNTISFGVYPDVPLADARAMCDEARAMVAKGQDPSPNKQEVRRKAGIESAGAVTFLGFTNFEEGAAIGEFWRREYVDGKRKDGSAKTEDTLRLTKIQLRALQRPLGHLPLKDITAGDVRAVLTALCRKGNVDKAHRCLGLAIRIFDLAVAHELCQHNVASACKSAVDTHHREKFPALTDALEKEDIDLAEAEARVGDLLRRISAHKGTRVRNIKALEMMFLCFPRPHNVVEMKWDDVKDGVWTIVSGKMKMRRTHKIQLSRQALAILDFMRPATGNSKGGRVFPIMRDSLRILLQRLGYNTTTEQSVHGIRSIASTLLHESGLWTSDAIERQMAHSPGGRNRDKGAARAARVKGIYNKAQHRDERKDMMQWWADYLDRLAGSNVVQLQAAE